MIAISQGKYCWIVLYMRQCIEALEDSKASFGGEGNDECEGRQKEKCILSIYRVWSSGDYGSMLSVDRCLDERTVRGAGKTVDGRGKSAADPDDGECGKWCG